jgi:RNA polymerase-associated protein RTF1
MTTLEEDILGLMGGEGDGSKANKEDGDNLLVSDDSSDDEEEIVIGGGSKRKRKTAAASSSGKAKGKKKKKGKTPKRKTLEDSDEEDDGNESDEDVMSFSSDEKESDDDDDDDDDDEFDEDEEDLPAVPLKKRGKSETKKKKKKDSDAGDSDSEGSIDFNLADYDDGYGSDLMGDGEDRERLLAMNELDREMELYDRQEKRDELGRQKAIMLELKAERDKKKAATRAKKTRSQTKKTNNKKTPADKRKSALSQLLARRDKKVSSRDALRNMADERELEYQDGYDDGYDGDDDYSDDYLEEEDEYGTLRRKNKLGGRKRRENLEEGELGEEYDVEASFEEVQAVLITRSKILEWIREPFLEDAMLDQFIRLAIGSTTDQQSGVKKSVYRLVQVCEVYERKPGKYQAFKNDPFIRSPYQLAPGLSTNKWLKVKIGKSTATFPMTIVSNSKLEESEFEKYCEDCVKAGVKQPLRSDCRFAKNAQKEAKEFRYTSADVAKLIEKRGRKTSNFAAERQHLISERDWAREQGDEEKTREYDEAVRELERKEKERIRLKGASDLARINNRNNAKNFEKMYHLTASQEKGGKMQKGDPFSRRPTAPLNYWSTKKRTQKTTDGESPEKGVGANKEQIEKTLDFEDRDAKVDAEEEEEHGKFPGIDIDFEVDLKLLDEPPARTKLILSSLKDGIPKITKALSISEYFEQVKMVQEQANH